MISVCVFSMFMHVSILCACVYVCARACVYRCVWVCVPVCACVRVCIGVCKCMHVMCAHLRVYMCSVRGCVCVPSLCVHVCECGDRCGRKFI